MVNTEFNLSSKKETLSSPDENTIVNDNLGGIFLKADVKEFIRLLKERLKANEVHTEITYDMVEDYIDELAGEELCNG